MKKLSVLTALSLAFAAPLAAGDGKIRAKLTGYQEVPSVSTVAAGRFEAEIHRDGQAFDWELQYSGLQGTVQQAHIHFAQKGVNGTIVVWLCGTTPGFPGPAGTQTCPTSGTISGTATAGNVCVVGFLCAATQQLVTGEIAEVIAAMRAGVAYANVHTTISPGGEIRGQIGGAGRGDDHHDHHH